MEIDSNRCSVSEKWARDHMQERSLSRRPRIVCTFPVCLCICWTNVTIWHTLPPRLKNGSLCYCCLYKCMTFMYLQSAGLRQEIWIKSVTRSGKLNITGHHGARASQLSARAPVWVSSYVVVLCLWCSDADVSIYSEPQLNSEHPQKSL